MYGFVALKVTNLLVYRYVQTSLVTAGTWGDPTQVAAGYIALFGSKAPAPPDRPQNFEELAQREKELTAMAGAKPEGTIKSRPHWRQNVAGPSDNCLCHRRQQSPSPATKLKL